MKKIIALVLSLIMLLSFAACSGTNGGTSGEDAAIDATDSLDLLTKVWGSYDDADKFSVIGGDFDQNNTSDAPGKFDATKADLLNQYFGVATGDAEMISDAASLFHMMNLNTFSAGAFKLTDGADAEKFVSNLKENVLGKQWLCGFPDKLVVITAGNYVISAFGAEDLINTFRDKVIAVFPTATVAAEESLA